MYARFYYGGRPPTIEGDNVIDPGEVLEFTVDVDASRLSAGDQFRNCVTIEFFEEPSGTNNYSCVTTRVVNGSDAHGDLVPDTRDNCPTEANARQEDRDKDGFGDVCDSKPKNKNKH